MSNGPNDDEIRRAERHAKQAKQTARTLSPFVEGNKLNNDLLKQVLDNHAPGNDAEGDGIYAQAWLSTDTFYRFTEDYVQLESRLAFRMELEHKFPGRKHGV